MNRSIIFRSKRIDYGTWIYGDISTKEHYTINGIPVFENAVGQFTGLHDKKGNMIFEGDIVIWPLENNTNHTAFISYKLGCFFYENIHVKPHPLLIVDEKKIEVIGNIHDNTELLKTK